MDKQPGTRPAARHAVQAGQWSLIAVALKVGFDAGVQISGPLLGVAMAANAAFFCSMLYGALVARVVKSR